MSKIDTSNYTIERSFDKGNTWMSTSFDWLHRTHTHHVNNETEYEKLLKKLVASTNEAFNVTESIMVRVTNNVTTSDEEDKPKRKTRSRKTKTS